MELSELYAIFVNGDNDIASVHLTKEVAEAEVDTMLTNNAKEWSKAGWYKKLFNDEGLDAVKEEIKDMLTIIPLDEAIELVKEDSFEHGLHCECPDESY